MTRRRAFEPGRSQAVPRPTGRDPHPRHSNPACHPITVAELDAIVAAWRAGAAFVAGLCAGGVVFFAAQLAAQFIEGGFHVG